nr:hypothetical protein [Tanacetum cinerariifolium]
MPTDPHHIPTILQPSTTQPQRIQKPRKPKRKVTQVPQLYGPTESVADEAVYKELDDSLVRATTTSSSLKVEQDSGNINKTQSKETPNKSSSQWTDLGGGPRCQEAIGDTIAQTRGESLDNEESLGEDSSKQGRIEAIDADEDITLVNVQADADMFNANKDLGGVEVFVEQEVVADKEKIDEDKGKGIMVEEHVKLKKKDQIRLDEEAALKLQAELDKEEQRLAKEKVEKELEANIALIET